MLEESSKSVGNKALVRRLRHYIEATLHRDLHLTKWDRISGLPSFIGHRYDFYTGKIASQPCLFAVDTGTETDTPAQIAKHITSVENLFPGIVIYTTSAMSSTRRSRLIDAEVAFTVPGNQLYVPQLAVDLRETFRSKKRRPSHRLSPAAQATFFYSILCRDNLESSQEERTPTRMATTLGYTQMSVGRAFDELAELGLATIDGKGRRKYLFLHDSTSSAVVRHRELLRSPVRSRRFAICRLNIPPMKIAGESALAHITGLSPPDIPCYAVHAEDWEPLLGNDIQVVKSREQAEVIVELWHYRPGALSEYATVDPFSLYAQFWKHPNERIAKSAREALEHAPW